MKLIQSLYIEKVIESSHQSTLYYVALPTDTCTHIIYRNGIWKCVGRLPEAHSSTIYSVDYAPAKAGHGRIASGGGDNRIQIYKEVMGSTSDQPMFTLDAAVGTNYGDVNCVRWHPWDGSTLCSAGDDGSVQLWHFEPS